LIRRQIWGTDDVWEVGVFGRHIQESVSAGGNEPGPLANAIESTSQQLYSGLQGRKPSSSKFISDLYATLLTAIGEWESTASSMGSVRRNGAPSSAKVEAISRTGSLRYKRAQDDTVITREAQ
jgi:hypothetical protein